MKIANENDRVAVSVQRSGDKKPNEVTRLGANITGQVSEGKRLCNDGRLKRRHPPKKIGGCSEFSD